MARALVWFAPLLASLIVVVAPAMPAQPVIIRPNATRAPVPGVDLAGGAGDLVAEGVDPTAVGRPHRR